MIGKDHLHLSLLLVKKMMVTILCLFLILFIGCLRLPGLNYKVLDDNAISNSLLMLTMFSGGNLHNLSMMSIGLSPFITAQIIIQLLQANISKTITYWAKSGENGRKKLDSLTKIITLIFAIMQSSSILFGIDLASSEKLFITHDWHTYFLVTLILVAGTFLCMSIADLISEKGLGNGVAVIISRNIIAQVPKSYSIWRVHLFQGVQINIFHLLLICVILLFFVTLTVWINNSERLVYLLYAKREYFSKQYSYIPFKIIIPGVMPVIFASTILAVPQTVELFSQSMNNNIVRIIQYFTSVQSIPGFIIFILLIIIFTYVYTFIQIDPHKLAKNLQRQEAYIPGINPGCATVQYLSHMLLNLAFPGQFCLTFIIGVPMLINILMPNSYAIDVSGTSLLIIVSTLCEIVRQIESILGQDKFNPFITNSYKFSR